MISNFSASGGGTAILGEMIYTTSVPKYTNPATFEVLQMEAFVFDLFETEVDTAHIQPFQFNNATYTIDSLEIKQRTLYIAISTEGEPEMLASDWHLAIDNRLIGYNSASSDYINNRTVYKLQFENFEQIPANLKLVPSTVIIKKQIDPIVFDLH